MQCRVIREKRGEHLGMMNFGIVVDQRDLFTGIPMENHREKLMTGVRCRFLIFFPDHVTGRRGDRAHQNGRRMAASGPDFLLLALEEPGCPDSLVIPNVSFIFK